MADISIIVPTRNRASSLDRTLRSIVPVVEGFADQTEIIVVDNGSIDKTPSVWQEIKHRYPKYNWRYFRDEMPGLLTGRHLGAKMAQGDLLAFLDDDVLLTPSWLEALHEAFVEPQVVLAGGPTQPAFEIEPPLWLEGMWVEFEEGVRVLGELSLVDLGTTKKTVSPLYIPGANFVIRKTALRAYGGFHPDYLPKPLQRYQGDGETGLAIKLSEHGLKAVYDPKAAVTHMIPASRLTPQSFEQRGFYQGVHNSYTTIRRDGALPAKSKPWKDYVRPIKWKLERPRLLGNPTAENIRRLVSRARFAGQWFHEREVRNDPLLLAWVLKADYFDYSLPGDWKSGLEPYDAPH